MLERRKKKWAIEKNIDWMDGIPLTLNDIKTFFDCRNLEFLLNDLVKKGYLSYEYPKKKIIKLSNKKVFHKEFQMILLKKVIISLLEN